jgi:formylglycine-generating enzyme required for sulfatase activity
MGSSRTDRGGSWGSAPAHARVANRNWSAPGFRGSNLGFRRARSVP